MLLSVLLLTGWLFVDPFFAPNYTGHWFLVASSLGDPSNPQREVICDYPVIEGWAIKQLKGCCPGVHLVNPADKAQTVSRLDRLPWSVGAQSTMGLGWEN